MECVTAVEGRAYVGHDDDQIERQVGRESERVAYRGDVKHVARTCLLTCNAF